MRLDGADVQRIADQVAAARFDRKPREIFGMARQQRREGRVGFDARVAQSSDHGEPFVDRRAMRFVKAADVFTVRGDGKADAQPGDLFQPREIAQDQRPAGLNREHARRMRDDCVENPGHHQLLRFGGLIWVHQGRAINPLLIAQLA